MGQCHRKPLKRYPSSSARISVSRPQQGLPMSNVIPTASRPRRVRLLLARLALSDGASMKGVSSDRYFLLSFGQPGLTQHNRPAKFSNISSRNSRFCVKVGLECRRAN
jgi:hypothetical protein